MTSQETFSDYNSEQLQKIRERWLQQMLTIWKLGNNLIKKKYSLTQRGNQKHTFKLKKMRAVYTKI